MPHSKHLITGAVGLAMLAAPLGAGLAFADGPSTTPTPAPSTTATPSGPASTGTASTPAGPSSATTGPSTPSADPSTTAPDGSSSPSAPTTSAPTTPAPSVSTPAPSPSDPSSSPVELATPVVTVTPSEGDTGMTVTFKVTGCDAPATGIELAVLGPDGQDWNDAVVTRSTGSSATRTLTAKTPGWYSGVAVCTTADGHGQESEQADTIAFPTGINFSKDSWSQGEKLTLTTYGFEDGEPVTVTVTRKSGGSKSWTLTAGASGEARQNVFSDVVLPYLGNGSYTITIKGSTYTRTSSFYWGAPDGKNPGGGQAKPRPVESSAPAPQTPVQQAPVQQVQADQGRPGLPSTGV